MTTGKPGNYGIGNQPQPRGRTAVWTARLVIMVMINLAQLWLLAAVVDAALARGGAEARSDLRTGRSVLFRVPGGAAVQR